MKLLTYLQKTHQITRREFSEMIREQAISLNGQKVAGFDDELQQGDLLKIKLHNGETFTQTVDSFPTTRPKLILYHKPVGYVVSKADKFNKTIYDILPERRHKEYYYIGRLDKESSWLLLLTNDPTLVDYYEHPVHKIHKVYEVQINAPLKSKDILKMTKGARVTEDGVLVSKMPLEGADEEEEHIDGRFGKNKFGKRDRFKKWDKKWFGSKSFHSKDKLKDKTPSNKKKLTPEDENYVPPAGAELLNVVSIRYEPDNKGKHRLTITLDQWRNRHIRRLLKAFGYTTLKLQRVKIGKRRLGDIRPGKRKIETKRLT